MRLEEEDQYPHRNSTWREQTLIWGGKEQSVQSAWSWVRRGAPQGQQKDVIINYHIITLMYDNY